MNIAQWLRGRLGRLAVACVAVAIASAIPVSLGPRSVISGLSTDLLFWLRDKAFGPRHTAASGAVAIVVVDEATYAAPEFRQMPKEMWTPQLGAVLSAINTAEPRAIGFDLILPTTLGSLKPDFDQGFLHALHAAAQRLVMAKFQASGGPMLPYQAYARMAGGDSHVRSVNVGEDADGVTRSVPMQIASDDPARPPEASFDLDLARRGGAIVPSLPVGSLLPLNFDGGTPFLVYSFIDLYHCATSGNPDFFRSHFHDRIVLIGSALDVEDRRLTSRRFINLPENSDADRCNPELRPIPGSYVRATVPGIYVHATAIDNLLRDEVLQSSPPVVRIAVVAGAAAVAAALCLFLPLVVASAALAMLVIAIAATSTMLFQHALLAPMLDSIIAALLSFFLLIAFRLLITDRDKRLIREMFGLYLAPSVVEPMIAAGRLPELGGERRRISILFSDIAGFTTLTESADPARLASTLNAYFDGVSEAVMRNRGLVVEYMGDGVMAFFGAPVPVSEHAACALACARDINAFAEQFRANGEPNALGFGHTRIGVHMGEAVVGNFGGTRRFKYTALGDVVNATSRLEGLNKYFGTRICVSEGVRDEAGDENTRLLGLILLKGKAQPINVHELLQQGESTSSFMIRYGEAYRLLSEHDPDALNAFRELARLRPDDGCVRFYLDRLEQGATEALVVMGDK